ncbi:lysophospholipid acyltransferase 7-like [Ischnura elegans]|uniref:lysophospholipid acyltransferase 7-like n=1 Tax=Ischnura elegans TaxID=197161 RepID=UPI001ED87697|nr:lysophospholipid acyltransferase 7-like [Ischnura elegans]
MDSDDVIYIGLLLLCIVFGHFYRTFFEDVYHRKWISTIFGLALIHAVSGNHIIHPILCVLINAVIITRVHYKYCHIVSFVVSFLYLIFFRTTVYFGIEYPPAHTNAVQMMLTLKVVGLAFEVHDAREAIDKNKGNELVHESLKKPIGFMDLFHYSFCYIGCLTGPYYRYRTYWDMLHSPFSKYAPCLDATFQRIKYVPLYAALYLITSHFFPLKYAETEEFYEERSVLYRTFFLTPCLFNFRLRIYIGFVLAECVCTMAGLGAYPVASDPRSGNGPLKYEVVDKIASDEERMKTEEYNFEAIHNIDPYGCEFVRTFRTAMKCWNMTVQYWLAVNVYKRVTIKPLRTGVTMFVSSLWHGVYAGYYLCLCSVPFLLPTEDLWDKLYRQEATGWKRTVIDCIFHFFRVQAFSYMGIAFLLLRIDATLAYWKSIYFIGNVVCALFYVVGIIILKRRKRLRPKQE